jgi:quercetin dioxygenase-like cupin family protein
VLLKGITAPVSPPRADHQAGEEGLAERNPSNVVSRLIGGSGPVAYHSVIHWDVFLREVAMFRLVVAVALGLVFSTSGRAQQSSPTPQSGSLVPFGIELEKMEWKRLSAASGIESATVVGDRSKPGLYIQVVRWPPHAIFKAHSHPDDRYAVVLSGTFYHGYGDKFDESKLEKRPAGSFFTEPARLRHFGVTKEEGTILYFVGTGPSTTDDVEK